MSCRIARDARHALRAEIIVLPRLSPPRLLIIFRWLRCHFRRDDYALMRYVLLSFRRFRHVIIAAVSSERYSCAYFHAAAATIRLPRYASRRFADAATLFRFFLSVAAFAALMRCCLSLRCFRHATPPCRHIYVIAPLLISFATLFLR